MRAQVLEEFNKPYVLKDVPVPKPEGGNVLVRVLAASYCHTDAVYAAGLSPPKTVPRVGCHEFAGTVEALGPSVPAELSAVLKVGTKVGVPVRGYGSCGKCRECVNNGDELHKGYSIYCPLGERLGLSADGGFQDYACADARQLEVIPEPLTPLETAPLMCAGLTIYTALKKAAAELGNPPLGEKMICISGAGGGLGHLGVQFAVKLGWGRVVAVDAADGPLKVVKDATKEWPEKDIKRLRIVDARSEKAKDIKDEVYGKVQPKFSGEQGVDAVIILPDAQRAFDYGIKLLRNHGICVVLSFPEDGFRIDAKDFVYRNIKMVGSLAGSNRRLREMLALAASGGVRALQKTYSLEDLNRLVEDYHQGRGGKLVVDMTSKV